MSTNLTNQQINFLQSLNLDPNSVNLKEEIQNLLESQKETSTKTPNSELSQILNKIYTEIIPELAENGQTWDIDYDFERKENKRYENLKKRGCSQIIKVD